MCNTGKHIGPIRKKEHSRQQKHAFMPFMTGLLFLFVIVKFKFIKHIVGEGLAPPAFGFTV